MPKDPKLERAGVSAYNKPKRTPNHPKKSHVVVAKEGDKTKTIHFGEQGASNAGKPKAGESEAIKKRELPLKLDMGRTYLRARCLLRSGQIKLNGSIAFTLKGM